MAKAATKPRLVRQLPKPFVLPKNRKGMLREVRPFFVAANPTPVGFLPRLTGIFGELVRNEAEGGG